MLNQNQFSDMLPSNNKANEWYPIVVDLFPKYGLSTANRIAGFMAQTSHESNDFKTLSENLNYSAARLVQVFPHYFTKATASNYARKPELIANHVYDDANRKSKLGNTHPGDGWRFRGKGLIQLTGRWNYEKFGNSIGMSAEEVSDYMDTKKGALESALWFWDVNNLNQVADNDDIEQMSIIVNGGNNGMSERIDLYERNKQILKTNSTYVNTTPQPDTIIGRGSRESVVVKIQRALGLPADGVYGVRTEAAVREWQRTNKYTITGKLDGDQIKKILGK